MLADYIQLGLCHRTVGSHDFPTVIASGFMSKDGWEKDFENYAHSRHALVYVIRGNGFFLDKGGVKYPLSAGSWFHRFQNVQHSTIIDPESHWVECFIDLPELFTLPYQSLEYFNKNVPVGINMKAMAWLDELAELIRALKMKSDFECRKLIPKMLELQMRIMDPFHDPKRANFLVDCNWVEDACGYFGKNIHERFSVRDYCKQVGIGYEKFRKDFVAMMNISPAKYCVRRRLDRSIELLMQRDPEIQIVQISDELGYKSSFEFSAQFKKFFKLSPVHYRDKFLRH